MTYIQYLILFYFIHSNKLLNLRTKSWVLLIYGSSIRKEKTTWELWLVSGAMVKNPSDNAGDARDAGSIPASTGKSPEKEMATYSSSLAWKILWTEEPGRATVHGLHNLATKQQHNLPHRVWVCVWVWVCVSCLVMSDSLAAPWTIAHQAPLSTEFSRQEYWSGLPFLSPGYLPDAGIKPGSPALQADSLLSEPPGKPKQYNNRIYDRLW